MEMWTRVTAQPALRSALRSRGLRVAVLIGCIAVLGYSLVRQLIQPGVSIYSSDFHSYYIAALAVRHGADPFTPAVTWIASYKPGVPFVASYYVYTPFFALLIVPFTWLSYPTAFVVWGLCNLAFLVGSVYACLRAAGIAPTWLRVLALSAAASLLMSIRFEFQWGQADLLVLFCVSAAFWACQERRPILAGVLLAVACVTKPPLLVLVPFLLWKREIRFAIAASVSFLALLLAPFLLIGGQALRDQFTIWQFWSNQYVSFIDNQAPKGVLARLFTVNPNVHPLFVAPILVTLGWLMVVAVVAMLTAAVVRPEPLRRDIPSLLEVGLVLTALLLISPLTEYIYLTLLVLPLLMLYVLLEHADWRGSRPQWRAVFIGLLAVWLLLVLPIQHIEYFFWPHMSTPSPIAALYVLLGTPHLYVLAALFALQLYVQGIVLGRSLRQSLRRLLDEVLAVARRRRALDVAEAIMVGNGKKTRSIHMGS